MGVLQVARAHLRRRSSLAKRAAAEVRKLWGRTDRNNIAASWTQSLPAVMTVMESAQAIAAASAGVYLDDVVEQYGLPGGSEGRVRVDGFAGVASDGRDLTSLMYQPAITALRAIGKGATVDRAMAAGAFTADLIAHTQVADAGRVADGVALAARPQLDGWVRMLSLPSCARCLILAGRWYRWDAGFPRHPNCVPAGVQVSGPRVDAATRRLYQGEMVILTTASGQELPITGNHPVLTDRGWVPANLIQEGDYVVSSTRRQGATALVVPGEDQVPSLIEDLWRPDGVVPLLHVPTTAEDFHGDGGYGEVDVVLADRLLRNGLEPAAGQFAHEEHLAGRVAETSLFSKLGPPQKHVVRVLDAADGFVGGGGLALPLLGGHTARSHLPCAGHVADFDASRFEVPSDGASRHSVAQAEAVFAFSGAVGSGDLIGGQRVVSPRWDAPAGPLSVQTRAAYADRGQDLFFRLAGQVELDRVVDLRRVEWSGHVYNLTSVEGWFSANGLIVSNCDCTHIPASEDDAGDARTDPMAAFRAMDAAEQDRVFTKAGAQAIRDGASIFQVVNARRGIRTAAPPANVRTLRSTRVTTEGTTRRGLAGRRLQGRARWLPEQIYAEANGSRERAVELLRKHGYLF